MRDDEATNICRQWWDAWTSSAEITQKRPLLAADLRFRFNTTITLDDRETFLTGESWPAGFTATMLGECSSGTQVTHFYEVANGPARLRVAELFTVKDGVIAEIDFLTDSGAYPAFLAGIESS